MGAREVLAGGARDIAHMVEDALVGQELLAHYQTFHDAYNQAVVGAEALVRWVHPDGTVLAPDLFVPALEKTPVAADLDWLVAGQAVVFAASGVCRPPSVSVNFSGCHLGEEGFTEKLGALVEGHGLARDRFIVELDGSHLLRCPDLAIPWIRAVGSAGFGVAIDKFGPDLGLANRLVMLPVDLIKFERTYLKRLMGSQKGRALLKGEVYLCRQLGCKTVAVGVESAVQLDYVQGLGFDYAQGYFFSKPVAADRVSGLR